MHETAPQGINTALPASELSLLDVKKVYNPAKDRWVRVRGIEIIEQNGIPTVRIDPAGIFTSALVKLRGGIYAQIFPQPDGSGIPVPELRPIPKPVIDT